MKNPINYQFDFSRSNRADTAAAGESYVVIGEYDYFNLRQVDQGESNSPNPDVLELVTLFPIGHYLGIDGWEKGRPEAGILMRLDLREPIPSRPFKPRREQKALSQLLHQALPENLHCLFFGSLSLHAVYLLIDVSNLSLSKALATVYSTCQANESIQSSILHSTTVPFGHPKKNSASPSIVNALIHINTPLGNQGKLATHIECEWESRAQTLTGDEDILVHLENIDFHLLLDRINQIQGMHVITRTSLVSDFRFISSELPPPQAEELTPIDMAAISNPLYRKKLEQLLRQLKNDAWDISPAFSHRLYALLRKVTENEGQYGQDAANLLDLLRDALIQRRIKRADISLDTDLRRSGLSLGAFLPLYALDRIAQSFYEDIRASLPPKIASQHQEWGGIVLASDRHGFAALPLDIILVPYNALLDPISPDGYWNTLSHEIAHIFASPIVAKLESGPIRQTARQYCEYLQVSAPEIERKLIRNANEFTAHWIDFLYPYGGDFKMFSEAIWSTWSPLLERSQKSALLDYHLRTFCVFLCAQDTELLPCAELPGLDSESYDNLLSVVDKYFSDYLSELSQAGISADYIERLRPTYRNSIAKTQLTHAALRMLPTLSAITTEFSVSDKSTRRSFKAHRRLADLRANTTPSLSQRIDALLAIVHDLESE